MKNLRKKLIVLFILAGIISFITPTGVNAALQSNGGTVATKTLEDWIVQIRQMETSGGTLGLSETINTTGLLATTGSNGLDCHMEKNTEYGALVILSASSYGNPSKVLDGGTTTGNATGVKMNMNAERVAAGAGLTDTIYAKNANSRYINNDYTTTPGGKYHVGDAMDIGNWHSSGATVWCAYGNNSGLERAYAGSIFSFFGDGFYRPYYSVSASRAVVVVGSGL